MINLLIIGNLVRDPEFKEVSGVNCCTMSVAVNRRVKDKQLTEYVRVTTWGTTADNCYKYLAKGRKVYVRGPVTAHGYIRNDGTAAASLEMTGNEVEFLSSAKASNDGFDEVEDDDNPFDTED